MRSEQEVVQLIKDNSDPISIKILRPQNITASFAEGQLINAINYLKAQSYGHLATISCVDWLKDNQFELAYHLFSYDDKINLTLKTRIDRKKAEFVTIKEIWQVARFYERDIHEFFGVIFTGNDDRDELILENWTEIPPMRKDFDTRKYVNDKYEWRDYHGQKYSD